MGRSGPKAGHATPPLPTRARLARCLGNHLPGPGQTVGLLGGSFNPAHGGHLHISKEALKRLQLDEVWWLVSPQNPLKARRGMAPLAQRLATARRLVHHPRIRVTDLERLLGTQHTAASLRRLSTLFPKYRFVWLMGADNLVQISRWHDWTQIFHLLPVATLARPHYSIMASTSKAATRFRRRRVTGGRVKRLALQPAPAWVLLRIRLSTLSASGLRQAQPSSAEGPAP